MAREKLERVRPPGSDSTRSAGRSSSGPRNQRLPKPKPKKSERPRELGQALRKRAVAARDATVRFGQRMRRPGLLILRGLLLLLSVAGLVVLGKLLQNHLTTSPAFAVDHVEVKGLARIERSELLETAGVDVGKNVFAESPESVRQRLLKHPWVAKAEVSRQLPGRFDIQVQEREPAALLLVEACAAAAGQVGARGLAREHDADDPSCDDPSALYLVSQEGTVFKRLEGEDPVDLPVITGVDRQRFGADPEFRQGVLLSAVALLGEYRAAGLWQRLPIGEIHVEADDALSIYVGEELTLVRLGHSPFDQKLRRMKKVFDRLAREHASAEYVYLDNERRPDRVTVRLR